MVKKIAVHEDADDNYLQDVKIEYDEPQEPFDTLITSTAMEFFPSSDTVNNLVFVEGSYYKTKRGEGNEFIKENLCDMTGDTISDFFISEYEITNRQFIV